MPHHKPDPHTAHCKSSSCIEDGTWSFDTEYRNSSSTNEHKMQDVEFRDGTELQQVHEPDA